MKTRKKEWGSDLQCQCSPDGGLADHCERCSAAQEDEMFGGDNDFKFKEEFGDGGVRDYDDALGDDSFAQQRPQKRSKKGAGRATKTKTAKDAGTKDASPHPDGCRCEDCGLREQSLKEQSLKETPPIMVRLRIPPKAAWRTRRARTRSAKARPPTQRRAPDAMGPRRRGRM